MLHLSVIPAKEGIQRSASARQITTTSPFAPPFASYARYRERWIPAFAGMTNNPSGI